MLGSVRAGPFQDFLAILKETGCRPSEAASVESQWFNRHGRCWELPSRARENWKAGSCI